jgi:hypothetical protein
MCARCIEIDKKIDHLKEISRSMLDPQTHEGIKALIAKLGAEKRDLHPGQQ